MSDVLDKICASKRAEIVEREANTPLSEVKARLSETPPPRNFLDALQAKRQSRRYGLIAEIKKASPSKGVIREDFDPQSLAKAYEAGGAACLSVLTDEPFFQGVDAYLPYQIFESRMIGADCVLLIVAALEDAQAAELEAIAFDLGMSVLIEVHNEAEMERALKLKSPLIGINNRNLKTLEVDIATTEALAEKVSDSKMLVSESGLFTPADLARMSAAGANCFLVGESLMREPDVAAATQTLLTRDQAAVA